ncbi:Sn1-specific diacylglycerol lipase beta [Paramyrothecium foliicola]|nr:Sn1-specific diacylglycerol lipase beta [Paramyrothecium foliicola]
MPIAPPLMATSRDVVVADIIKAPQPGPTLLPSPFARAVSLATRSTSLAVRLGFLVSSYSLDAAKFTTVSGLEVARGLVGTVLGKAGRDTVLRSRTDLATADAEAILERSLESLHQTVTQIVFWTTAGFRLTGMSISAASEVSQLALSFLDQLFGSTDSSRAIASIITLVRREFDNPATGAKGEKVSVLDLVVALAAVAYLQRQCRRCDEEQERRRAYEEVIWDVVVLNDGQRVDVHEESLSGIHRGHYRNQGAAADDRLGQQSNLPRLEDPSSNWQGLEEDDDAVFSRIRGQIASALPSDATVSVSSSVSTVQTITVDVRGSQPLSITPPPGAEVIESNTHLIEGGESSRNSEDQPSYRVVYRIERNKLRSATLAPDDQEAESMVDEVLHNQSQPRRQADEAMLLPDIQQPSDASAYLNVSTPAANQKKQRSPPNPRNPHADAANLPQEIGDVRRILSDEQLGTSTTKKGAEKRKGLKQVLKGSGQSISNIWHKDSSSSSAAEASTPKAKSGLKPSVPPYLPGTSSPSRSRMPGRQAFRDSHPSSRSPSRASRVSIHEHRRDSIISTAESYSASSGGGLRPASPTIIRREVAAEESITRPRNDSNSRGSVPPSPQRHHRRLNSSQSIYGAAMDESQTSLVLSSYHQKSVYSASDALNVLRREGIVSGTFPHAHLLDNVTRYMRFSSASYGSHFLKFLGISKDLPLLQVQDDIHQDVRHFVHHTESEAGNILLASFIDPQGGTDATGKTGTGVPLVHYISLDHAQKAVVLVCRGTLGFEDVMADVACDYDVLMWRGRGYKVHKGIHASARRLLYGGDGRVLVTLREALEEFPEYGLVMCGHSLGGAVTAILGIMLSEPNPKGVGFVTSTEPHNRLVADGKVVEGSINDVRLPSGRRIHIYAYGSPGVMSRSLSLITRGLITSVVHGNDVVPHLSLGLLHDFQAVALGFKKDDNQAKADIRQQIWRALQENVTNKWHNNSAFRSATGDDKSWMLPALANLRSSLKNEKLYPPGEVFTVESKRVLRRDAFLGPDEEHIGRPAQRVVLKYVKDVEARFGEVRFGASMLLDHSPARRRGLDLALVVVEDLLDLDGAQVVDALAELAVVVEEVGPALELDDGVVGGPAQDGLEDAAAIGEGAEGALGGAVAQEVGVAGGVGEVVGVAALVQPRGLEEAAVVVVAEDGLAGLGVEDGELLDVAVELAHVGRELRGLGALGSLALAGDLLGALPLGVEDVVALLVALELAAPQAAKVEVGLTIVVDEGGRVNAKAAANGLGFRGEGTLWGVAYGHADAEDALLVARREVEVEFTVGALGAVWCPHLLGDPGDVLGAENDAVVGDLARGGVERGDAEDVVVGHVVLVAIVVELNVRLAVVRRVDVDLAVEDVGRGVSRVDVGDQGRHDEQRINCSFWYTMFLGFL